MSEKPEAFQVAKQLTLRAIEELTEDNVRLRLENKRLREALKDIARQPEGDEDSAQSVAKAALRREEVKP